jgi:hypothetical protein
LYAVHHDFRLVTFHCFHVRLLLTMTRIERERHQDLSNVVDRLDVVGPDGGAVVLVTTTTVSTYPATAGAFYAANPTEIDGSEIEGGAASYTADTTRLIYVLNQGTQVPPVGTRVIAHGAGGRWVFRYDG